MTDPELISSHLTDYLQLHAAEAGGMAELDAAGHRFGIVENDRGHPELLMTPGGRVPLIQIDADAGMERVALEDVIGLLEKGVPGLVAVRDSQPVGILTAGAVARYVAENFQVSAGVMGDFELHGDPPITPLTMTCVTCGASNTIPFFVAGQTECVNGHPLAVTWE